VRAALENPLRRCHRLLLTTTAAEELAQAVGRRRLAPQMLDNSALSDLLPAGAVHQGAALQADPLPDAALEELIERSMAGAGPMLLLDQISDPHNVGAILRSAAAFGVAGLVLLERHAPPLTGVLAKAASGGLEHVALARVTNLARCLEDVAEAGLCVIGLDEHAGQDLAQVKRDNAGKAFALVLGAEGRGMRRLTREKCHFLARLACPGPLGSLNVSNAAAVALYELTA
jgi:23S rRNA (guanosine2251-2'-O)-methyltransferase